MKAPIAGGPAVVLASGQQDPAGVAIDATSVYWTNEGTLADGGAGGVLSLTPK
jgi:hypothetical protein